MKDIPSDKGSNDKQLPQGCSERVVYVIPEEANRDPDGEISLRDLWGILWREKWAIIVITTTFALASVVYALVGEEWYRAEVLLVPADQRSTLPLGGQLGGLAALAGVSIGGADTAQAIATLRSRELARDFIEDRDLVKVFFADHWDQQRNAWNGDDPSDWPDVRDAIRYFHDNILKLNQERQTGLVTLAIEWKDPEVAAIWATDLVRRVNETLRDRALREAEVNLAYLEAELSRTTVLALQASIGRLLESELQKLMLARGNEEFAFNVIDPASPPRERVRPKRAMVSLIGLVGGAIVAILFVLLRHGIRDQEAVE